MMQAKTIARWSEPFKRLGHRCRGYSQDTPDRDMFVTACGLLLQPAAFELEGADEKQVEEAVQAMAFEGVTFEEAGYRRGVADSLKKLQENMRITEQEARKLLGLDEVSGAEKAPSKPLSNLSL